MTGKTIEIHCPAWRLERNEENRQRLAACYRLQPVDRVPVTVTLHLRYVLWGRGIEPGAYFDDARVQLEQQLLNHKWIVENILDDRAVDTRRIAVGPDLDTLRGLNFPVGIGASPDGSLVARPCLHEAADIAALEMPEVPAHHAARKVAWYHAMRELAPEYQLTLNCEPMEIQVGLGAFGGPFPDAYALAGNNLFLWMHEAPDLVHRLMRIVTDTYIAWQRYVRRLTGAPAENLFMGADAAEMLSPAMFREFVLPYYQECYRAFPGQRGLHMCGKIDHLLPILAEEMAITQLNGFGAVTNPYLLAQWLGGRAIMAGGPDPLLLLNGSPEEIKREARRYLEILAPLGGYILQDGCGLAPGTDPARVQLLVEASRDYAGQRD